MYASTHVTCDGLRRNAAEHESAGELENDGQKHGLLEAAANHRCEQGSQKLRCEPDWENTQRNRVYGTRVCYLVQRGDLHAYLCVHLQDRLHTWVVGQNLV